MDRRQIADIFEACATLLELKGENPFRANAYRNAARAVLQLQGDLETLFAQGALTEVKGIGKTMAEKIAELVHTGELSFYKKLKAEVPAGLVDMLRISGFGPKRAKHVYDELGIQSIEALRAACLDGRIAALKGFGKKSAEKILAGIEFLDKTGKRILFPIAFRLAQTLREHVAADSDVERIEICGSLRRRKETIQDIDLLVATRRPESVMQRFVASPGVAQILGQGPTKSSVLLENGVQADLRAVTRAQFPFALHYFTGSKEHNIAMRARAQSLDLRLNEYELAGPKKSVHCKEEADIFEALGLQYIPPELREDTGEIDAASRNELPILIEESDITGVFHCHTNASDGSATLAEMARGAKALGYQFLGIADHSRSAFYANGLDSERVRAQIAEIDAFQAKEKGIRLFKGIESDILADGALDYDEATLARFDYVVASIHSPMNMNEKAMTERVIRAIRNPYCTMLGHATGRLLLARDPYPMDLEAILVEAAKHNVMIEINANPHRLDLDWIWCKRAKSLGITLVINPDAHSVEGIADTTYGVSVARRGWLTKDDVFNTRSVEDIARQLEQRKKAAPPSH